MPDDKKKVELNLKLFSKQTKISAIDSKQTNIQIQKIVPPVRSPQSNNEKKQE